MLDNLPKWAEPLAQKYGSIFFLPKLDKNIERTGRIIRRKNEVVDEHYTKRFDQPAFD